MCSSREGSTRRTCQFQNLGSEVFKDSRSINGRLSANTYVILCAYFQVPMDTSNRELKEKKECDGLRNVTDPRRAPGEWWKKEGQT
jgi:hypothetical protein